METSCIAYGVNNDAMYTWVYSRTVAHGAVVNINIGLYLLLPSFLLSSATCGRRVLFARRSGRPQNMHYDTGNMRIVPSYFLRIDCVVYTLSYCTHCSHCTHCIMCTLYTNTRLPPVILPSYIALMHWRHTILTVTQWRQRQTRVNHSRPPPPMGVWWCGCGSHCGRGEG